MCGIFGYIGKKDPQKTVLEGLKKLEYRGYDSAGIAGVYQGKIFFWKEVGKVAELEKEVMHHPMKLDVAIAQTRWATHGGVTRANAHPHLNGTQTIALVHNGIIENFEAIKEELIAENTKFRSETDTEVIVHLISKYYEGDLTKAIQKATTRLKGAFSIAVVHADHPDMIVAVAQESPLVIGIGSDEVYVSSDYHAFAFDTREVVYLSHGEIATVKVDSVQIFNASHQEIKKEKIILKEVAQAIDKGAYSHFTLKEIFEQPSTFKSALLGRFIEDYGTALFEDLAIPETVFKSAQRILILGCGTSLHAGYVASYMIEELAGIPVQVEISSEYRYKNPVIQPNTLVIAISQSGETADTIAAVKELKAKGAVILAISNVYASSITREADGTIFLKAGPEIGVCSTKAFTSQLAVLSLITLLLARMRHMTKEQGQQFIHALKEIPEQIKTILNQAPQIQEIAKNFSQYENFFFIGRNYMYPTALEGALKLKEISYINANGYPAGEMKHGPIALINPDCPTVALCANHSTYSKILSNIMEVRAREGQVISIAPKGAKGIEKLSDAYIEIPDTIDPLASTLTTIVTQLFAYYIAQERGADIDKPRNLAKSVTVE